jgi:L-fuconolactonase
MRIDSHQHFWNFDPAEHLWMTEEMSVLKRDFLPQHLVAHLTSNGIDATIAVQARQSENETFFLLELAARHSFIAGIVGWVNLLAHNVADRLAYFSQFPKIRGFRHVVQDEPDDRFMLRDEFVRGVALLREFHFTYDVLIFPRQLPSAIALLEKCPEQHFVIDHIAKPLVKVREIEAWAKQMKIMAANPNVYCKLSGLVTEADWSGWRAEDLKPYLDVVWEAFGPDRLMFGSDWPVCLLAGSYRQVKCLVEEYVVGQSASAIEDIFGENANRFYRLDTARASRTVSM